MKKQNYREAMGKLETEAKKKLMQKQKNKNLYLFQKTINRE